MVSSRDEEERPVVHLIDAHVYVFRAFYAMPDMMAPDGTPTGATYGFASTLLKYLAAHAVTHAALCFDWAMESFRNEIFPLYKATRGSPPEDLVLQFALCGEVARALGLPVFEQERYEADDLIATLTAKLVSRGANVVVVTSDKDLAQLVREDASVVLYDLARDAMLDASGVRAKFGVDPQQIPDYLALVGDTVDNLPGVPGVGPRSASAALRAFGTIEDIPADPRAWAGVPVRGAARLARAIDGHREQALRVRELATVEREVPGVRCGLDSLAYRGAYRDRVSPLFERLGWKGIGARVARWRD
ncbi:MAG TPA: 5'-3' exonuclease H3TH domain-containing protein [Myxococcota bacterium]|nr:5'-3' exonuclease H3TH domain-containing protein [Myxococcota bacterium]